MKNEAIYCECYIYKYHRYKILGSITSEGYLEIMRNHENKTIIDAPEFTIQCKDCGFKKEFKIVNVPNIYNPIYTL